MLSKVRSEAVPLAVFLHMANSLSLPLLWSAVQDDGPRLFYFLRRYRGLSVVVRIVPATRHPGFRCDWIGCADVLARHLVIAFTYTGEITTRDMRRTWSNTYQARAVNR